MRPREPSAWPSLERTLDWALPLVSWEVGLGSGTKNLSPDVFPNHPGETPLRHTPLVPPPLVFSLTFAKYGSHWLYTLHNRPSQCPTSSRISKSPPPHPLPLRKSLSSSKDLFSLNSSQPLYYSLRLNWVSKRKVECRRGDGQECTKVKYPWVLPVTSGHGLRCTWSDPHTHRPIPPGRLDRATRHDFPWVSRSRDGPKSGDT